MGEGAAGTRPRNLKAPAGRIGSVHGPSSHSAVSKDVQR